MVTIKWTIIHPVKRTYEQMKSSGHLRLVSNNEVSNSISKYYNSLSEFDGYNEAGMLWAADYVESLGKIFDAEIMLNIMRTRQMKEANKKNLVHKMWCDKCKKVISAKKSCCVFCDYGDRKCPVAAQH